MRLCFYNPQAVNSKVGRSLLMLFFPFDKTAKHGGTYSYWIDVMRGQKYDIALVVDGAASSLPFGRIGRLFYNYYFLRFFSFFEIYLWCAMNRINPFKRKIIFSLKDLDPQYDVLFGFTSFVRTFVDEEMTERSFFKKFTGKKILHATHYFGGTKRMADNVRRTGTTLMAAEANLKNSGYFNAHFDFIKKVYVLPFVLRPRYVSTADFSLRKNKCLAMGNLGFFAEGHPHTEDYYAYFKINTLHPMRAMIVKNREQLAPVIDSFINAPPAVDERTTLSVSTPAEKKYHSFNIVERYNQYRMFIAPEESIGLPSVNCIEGMACGCAYIGLDCPIYTDYGFKNGVHYIAYDGTLQDLQKKIEYYQGHPDELRKIAEAGRKYVAENFNRDVIVERFFQAIQKD